MQSDSESTPRIHRVLGYTRNFWILIVTWIIFSFSGNMSMVFYPNYIVALGGPEAVIGLIFALNNAIFALTQIPGGYLADRVGRKKLVVSMTWLIALDYALIALAPTWEVLAVAAILDGASRMYVSALHALLYDSLPEDKRASGLAISRALPSLLAIPAPLIGGLIASALGEPTIAYRVLFGISSLMAIAAATLRLYLEETITPVEKLSLRSVATATIEGYRDIVSIWRDLQFYLKSLLLIVGMVPATALGIYAPYLVRVARIRMGYSDAEWGMAITISIALSSTIMLLSTPLIDKVGYSKLIAMGLTTISCGLIALQFVEVHYIVYAALPLIYIGRTLYTSGYASYLVKLAPLHMRGRIASLDNVLGTLGMITGNVVGAFLFEKLFERTFLLSVAIYVATAIMAMIRFAEVKEFES